MSDPAKKLAPSPGVPQITTTAASPGQADTQAPASRSHLTVGVPPPSFSPMPPDDADIPPTPTMFPLTQERFHHGPSVAAVAPNAVDMAPSPNPIDITGKLHVKPPPVSPLPSPGTLPATPRLTEEEAKDIDIWFFRNEMDNRGEFTQAEGAGLTQWKAMKAQGEDLIPLTPVPSR